MYELVKVRLNAVGPGRARFKAVLDLSGQQVPKDRSAAVTASILGDNGVGKTLLARLIRLVLWPENIGRPWDPEPSWQNVVSATEVGQVILEWRKSQSNQRIVTALALKSDLRGTRLSLAFYCLKLQREPDTNLLIPPSSESTFSGLHNFIKQAAVAMSADLMWTTRISKWHSHLNSLGLSPTGVSLISGESVRLGTGDDFILQLIRHVIRHEELATLDKLDVEASRSVAARGALLAALTEMATRFLHSLSDIERLSEFPSAGAGFHKEPFIKFTFRPATEEELRRRIEVILERELAARAEGRGRDILLPFRVIKASVGDDFRAGLLVAIDNGSRVNIDDFTRLSGGQKEFCSLLFRLLLVRVQAVCETNPTGGCVVFVDAGLRFAADTLERTEILASWGMQVIYLSAIADATAYSVNSIFSLQIDLEADLDEYFTSLKPAITLAEIRSQHQIVPAPIAMMDVVAVDEIFDILTDFAEVQSGDFLVPTVRRAGSDRPVSIATRKTGLSHTLGPVTILRPRYAMRTSEDLFYATYLGSDSFLGGETMPGQLVLVSAQDLACAPLPRPDRETLHAISELTEAASTFDSWRRDADDAVRSFFQWRDLPTARAKMLETGRLTRQRREAAHVLDSAGARFRSTLPYPMARRWRDVEAATSDEAGFRRIIDCAEIAITYCAVVGLAFASTSGVAVPRLRAIAGRLSQTEYHLTFGDWASVISDLIEIANFDQQPIDSPLQNYRWFAGDVRDAMGRLKRRRNDISHGRVPSRHEIASQIASARAELEKVLSAAEWLVDYPLRYLESEKWDSFTDTSVLIYRELMGDHNVVSPGNGEVGGHLEAHSAYIVDRFGRFVLLRPFLHVDYCGSCGQLTVFVIDGVEHRDQCTVYKAMDHSHEVRLIDVYSSLQAVGLMRV